MTVNGDSIYGSQRTPLPVQAWGESTLKGNRLYLHVFDWPPDGTLTVGGLKSTPTKAWLLADARHKPLKVSRLNKNDVILRVSASSMDKADSVVVLEFASPILTGSAMLLADHGQKNVLRAFDAELHGTELKYGDGKAPRAYVYNWTDKSQSLGWKVRLNQKATFDVAVRYTTGAPSDGGTYVVQVGDQKINATVDPSAKERDIRVSQIGRMTVLPGEYDLQIKPEEIEGSELMRIFEVVLTPVDSPKAGR
jgi:hypothetical protein